MDNTKNSQLGNSQLGNSQSGNHLKESLLPEIIQQTTSSKVSLFSKYKKEIYGSLAVLFFAALVGGFLYYKHKDSVEGGEEEAAAAAPAAAAPAAPAAAAPAAAAAAAEEEEEEEEEEAAAAEEEVNSDTGEHCTVSKNDDLSITGIQGYKFSDSFADNSLSIPHSFNGPVNSLPGGIGDNSIICDDNFTGEVIVNCHSNNGTINNGLQITGCSENTESQQPTTSMCSDYTCTNGTLKSNPDPTTTEQGDTPETTCCEVVTEPIIGCTDPTASAYSYNQNATQDTNPSSCQYDCLTTSSNLPVGYMMIAERYQQLPDSIRANPREEWPANNGLIVCDTASGYQGDTITATCNGARLLGNQLPSRFQGCVHPVLGCTDSGAINYSDSATQDNGTCQYNCVTNQVDLPIGYQFNPIETFGALSVTMFEQEYLNSGETEIIICDDGYTGNVTATCNNEEANTKTSGGYKSLLSGCVVAHPGCTDETADNRTPSANVDDGSCQYNCVTQTLPTGYQFADNFNPPYTQSNFSQAESTDNIICSDGFTGSVTTTCDGRAPDSPTTSNSSVLTGCDEVSNPNEFTLPAECTRANFSDWKDIMSDNCCTSPDMCTDTLWPNITYTNTPECTASCKEVVDAMYNSCRGIGLTHVQRARLGNTYTNCN